jgi:dihydroorotate dehydrogenase (fumarate)/dihydroorotate dehydrogenase
LGAYESFLRPLLFRFDAEAVHHAALSACALLPPLPRGLLAFQHPSLELEIAGLRFPGPVGLGGGLDKDGTAVRALAAMGFGSIEVGSVSAEPSAGNARRPRLFRLPQDEALLVYYGVPSDGADTVARRLSGVRLPVPLGVSIVETNTGKANSLDGVIREFQRAMRALTPVAGYIALNLQCPNSERAPLDDPTSLRALLSALGSERPLFLKVAASTDPRSIDAFLQAIDPFPAVRGVILSTLLPKPYTTLRTPAGTVHGLPGSLAGAPLKALARELVSAWYARIDRKRHVLVGVGGVQSAEDAYALIRRGATLVQLVTALVYQGPRLPGRIHRGLARLLERDGVVRLTDAVGVDAAQA